MPRKAEGAGSSWRVTYRAEGPPPSWEGRLLSGSHALFTDKAVSLGVQTPRSPQRPVLEVNDRLYHVPQAAGQPPRPPNLLGQVGAGPQAAPPSSGHSSVAPGDTEARRSQPDLGTWPLRKPRM